ncbi:MAG TPA: fumarylacetoacetate hydrolase family protein [Kiloniellales bacterium]|nr:fumarylacetoacetate hydrolase family protein [Kiloniellales bacterium]
MSAFHALPRWPQPAVAIAGRAERFPVRRIFCIGRNYADHVREMGGDPSRGTPIFFMKPADALVESAIAYPPDGDLHYEVELVAALGEDLQPWGYAVGLDLTRRDRQAKAKKDGTPWEAAKAFEGSAVVGPLLPAAQWNGPASQAIRLSVNGATRQDARLDQMIWALPEILSELQQSFTLKPGDLVFTGTPAGVGALAKGDRVEASVDGLPGLSTRVV